MEPRLYASTHLKLVKLKVLWEICDDQKTIGTFFLHKYISQSRIIHVNTHRKKLNSSGLLTL